MSEVYHGGQRELQARFDSTRLADRLAEVKMRAELDAADAAFIAARDMLFLASADAEGRPSCSYKGGDPGFVRVLDARTVAFPCYDGNGMFVSMGNALVNPHVGLLFIDFERGRRLRAEGQARLRFEHPLLAEFPEAQFLVEVRLERVYPNCPRYIHRYRLEQRSPFVPRAACETPCRSGSGANGRTTCCRRAIPRSASERPPGHAGRPTA
jgi:predicted pyridoxine 5'-phosphate oxidase superfamily flavin-nucleotide-binding protein